jgi:serine/threonine-protein phosphatase 6 regulatory ankyrin repeat subunit B
MNGRRKETGRVKGLPVVVVLIATVGLISAQAAEIDDAFRDACAKGRLDEAERLIDKGADVNAGDRYRDTALMAAAGAGRAAMVELLLERGANIDAQDMTGMTALMDAACAGHIDVLKVLLDHGADCSVKTGAGVTAVGWATGKGRHDVKMLLLERCGRGRAGAVSRPGRRRARMSRLGDRGRRPLPPRGRKRARGRVDLVTAAKLGNVRLAEALLKSGAGVNATDESYGATPLIWAAFKGHLPMVKLLLDNGANVNAVNKDGRTALILASHKSRLRIVELLLRKGADATIKSKDGMTAVELVGRQAKAWEELRALMGVGGSESTKASDSGEPERTSKRSNDCIKRCTEKCGR